MARGSITPRPTKDGKIRYRVKWESRGPDGKRRHHSATRPTKKDAEAFLAKQLSDVESGAFVVASRESLSVFLARWLEATAPTWTDATLYEYRSVVRHRIDPYIGHVPLGNLDELTIQHCYAQLLAKGYSASSIAMTHSILDSSLGRAVAWRILPRNPTDGVTVPAVTITAPQTWSADEAAAFVGKTQEDVPYGALWRLGLDSGMRLGEMLVLTWRDLDTTRGIVAVRRTLTRSGDGGWKIGEHAKTSKSRRSIHLAAETVAALRSLRAPQNERRLAAGKFWVDRDLNFAGGDGDWFRPQRIRYQFERAVARCGLPSLTPHGMRHTMATLMLAAGVHPKIVQERLGHTTIQMTLDRYSHVTMGMQEEAAKLIGDILGGSSRPRRGHEAG
jgi:integrase